jgi:hypothetical protein
MLEQEFNKKAIEKKNKEKEDWDVVK